MNICKGNTIRLILQTMLISSVFYVTTSASAAPTKKDTYDFIANKVTYNSTEYDGRTKHYKLSADNNMCILSYVIETYDETNNWYSTYQQDIDLMTLNPQTVDTGKTIIGHVVAKVETKEKKPLIKCTSTYSDKAKAKYDFNKDQTKYDASSLFYTKESDDARRVSKALKHLIFICGGKDELF